jgi:hypothetical protein
MDMDAKDIYKDRNAANDLVRNEDCNDHTSE